MLSQSDIRYAKNAVTNKATAINARITRPVDPILGAKNFFICESIPCSRGFVERAASCDLV